MRPQLVENRGKSPNFDGDLGGIEFTEIQNYKACCAGSGRKKNGLTRGLEDQSSGISEMLAWFFGRPLERGLIRVAGSTI